jgi:hypothetical protein
MFVPAMQVREGERETVHDTCTKQRDQVAYLRQWHAYASGLIGRKRTRRGTNRICSPLLGHLSPACVFSLCRSSCAVSMRPVPPLRL